MLDLLPDLRVVANYGVGYDRVNVDACRRRGITVTNTPGVLDAATADLAFALLLAAQRRVVEGDREVRAGDWRGGVGRPRARTRGDGLDARHRRPRPDRRRGCAACRRLRAARPLHEAVRLDQPTEQRLGLEWRELDDLLRESDVVSLHVPRTPETTGLLDARRLALLRDGAVLVNTARAEVVDRDALIEELVSGRLRAGLDVFWDEPNVPAELLELPNVVLTPHIGSATEAARHAMTRIVVDNVIAVLAGREAITAV